MNHRLYTLGDRVRFNYGYATPGDSLAGRVTAIEDVTTEVGANQILTVEWVATVWSIPVTTTREYAQDLLPADAPIPEGIELS